MVVIVKPCSALNLVVVPQNIRNSNFQIMRSTVQFTQPLSPNNMCLTDHLALFTSRASQFWGEICEIGPICRVQKGRECKKIASSDHAGSGRVRACELMSECIHTPRSAAALLRKLSSNWLVGEGERPASKQCLRKITLRQYDEHSVA